MNWSLLNFEFDTESETIPKQTLVDLHLDALFSENVLRIFSVLHGKKTIAARQEVFRLLNNQIVWTWINELYEKLKTLSLCVKNWESSNNEIERAFVFCNLIDAYIGLLISINDCKYENSFFKLISEKSEKQDFLVVSWKKNRYKYVDLLNIFSTVLYRYRINEGSIVIDYDETENSYNDMVKNAEELFNDIVFHEKNPKLSLSDSIADAMTIAYRKEIDDIKRIQEDYIVHVDFSILDIKSEIEFYFEVSKFVKDAEKKGIPICMPTISDEPKFVAEDAIDPALINHIEVVVSNSVDFIPERSVSWLAGVNSGGKTTYLRTIGSNLVLFLSGAPVFCRNASIFPFINVYTHFPSNETHKVGRFDEECTRVETILSRIKSNYFVLLNETFSSTDSQKGLALGERVLSEIVDKSAFGLFVSHFDIQHSTRFNKLYTEIDYENNGRPTFHIVSNENHNYEYVQAILKKYKLDAKSLKERLYG